MHYVLLYSSTYLVLHARYIYVAFLLPYYEYITNTINIMLLEIMSISNSKVVGSYGINSSSNPYT